MPADITVIEFLLDEGRSRFTTVSRPEECESWAKLCSIRFGYPMTTPVRFSTFHCVDLGPYLKWTLASRGVRNVF